MQTTRLNKEYLQDRYEYWMRGKQGDGNLYNEKTFYRAFIKDALEAKKEVIIYSPFVAKFRTDFLKPTIEKLRDKNIEVFVFTRPVEEYDSMLQGQIRVTLERYEEMGVCVFFMSGYIHEKVAIIDREIIWEGSLNILSQRASREMMRRTLDEDSAMQVIEYLKLQRKLAEGYKQRYEKLCHNLISDARKNLKLKLRMFLLGLSIPTIFLIIFACLQSNMFQQNLIMLENIIKLLFLTKYTPQ